VVAVSALRQPGGVDRTGMRHRQPRSTQAGSGQEERECQDAALPEGTEHGAKLARAALTTRPKVGLRRPRVPGLRLAHQADELGAAS
jgi:hypothetical protein